MTWSLPCRPNAKIDKFIIECRRTDVEENVLKYIKEVTDNREDFVLDSRDFSPDSVYRVSVWAFANNQLGLEEIDVFEIEAGCKKLLVF